MTSLERFLNKATTNKSSSIEPASGSFQCQNKECDEIIHEGYIDRTNNRIHWECSKGHESSVIV